MSKKFKQVVMSREKTIVRKEEVIAISPREIETIQLIANEKSREDIADSRGLTKRTIEAEIYKIMTKVGTKTQEGTIALFFRNGLIK